MVYRSIPVTFIPSGNTPQHVFRLRIRIQAILAPAVDPHALPVPVNDAVGEVIRLHGAVKHLSGNPQHFARIRGLNEALPHRQRAARHIRRKDVIDHLPDVVRKIHDAIAQFIIDIVIPRAIAQLVEQLGIKARVKSNCIHRIISFLCLFPLLVATRGNI